eukprot:TRINITY_DN26441_c0_g1_i2.p1 TRINITY_DN26441_c0_g1~~TRINITY_DN26441_c0_g1_i2.p1  ORF type:complete len:706 (+),score=99.36 TRINITY_DN26441_c0_g1_i2:40-2118(+)
MAIAAAWAPVLQIDSDDEDPRPAAVCAAPVVNRQDDDFQRCCNTSGSSGNGRGSCISSASAVKALSKGETTSERPAVSLDSSLGARVILHLDINTFFLSVHKRYDQSLHAAGPLVLWQYNDVICVSPDAKAAGVRKHMRPSEAQPIVNSIGGRLIHAYSRKWPGPRVWYGPYTQSGRDVLAFLQRFFEREVQGPVVVERASVDEVFVDISAASGGSLDFALSLSQRLVPELQQALGMVVSVGVARNKLLAKLASVAAKPPASGFHVVRDDGQTDAGALLRSMAPNKLPGLGSKAAALAADGVECVADLVLYSRTDMQNKFGLGVEAAKKVYDACRGIDPTPVKSCDPKKSLSASSWMTDAVLSDLASKVHHGRGSAGITVGNGWVFEPHTDTGISNATRARWLLLSLVMDLDERVVDEFLETHQLPTKVTISYMGPGHCREPGMPGFTNGQSRSRTVDFPTTAYRDVNSGDVRAPMPETGGAGQDATSLASSGKKKTGEENGQVKTHPVYGTQFLVNAAPIGVTVFGLADGPEVLNDVRYRKRISALLDVVGNAVVSWSAEPGQNQGVAHLCLTARTMVVVRASRSLFFPPQARRHDQVPQRGSEPAGEQLAGCSSQQQQQSRTGQKRPASEAFERARDSRSSALQQVDSSREQKAPQAAPSSLQSFFKKAAKTAVQKSLFDVPSFDVSDDD